MRQALYFFDFILSPSIFESEHAILCKPLAYVSGSPYTPVNNDWEEYDYFVRAYEVDAEYVTYNPD